MRISRGECVGLIVDVQERLFPHMWGKEEVEPNIALLVQGLRLFEVPLILTEQYPKGLGRTTSAIADRLPDVAALEKLSFSCWDDDGIRRRLLETGRRQVIVAGIEAHVCILQTIVDLKDAGFIPIVVKDCVSSRRPGDTEVALLRIRSIGTLVTTVESLLFEICRFAGTDEFRSLSHLIKTADVERSTGATSRDATGTSVASGLPDESGGDAKRRAI